MATILIPTPLRKYANSESKVTVSGSTVHESLQSLSQQFPELQRQLFDDSGQLRSFLRIYKGETDIRALNQSETPVSDESVISIIPAIAGGRA